MKAVITVIDDNGRVICANQVLSPTKEEIVELKFMPTIKEARFDFTVTQYVEPQRKDNDYPLKDRKEIK